MSHTDSAPMSNSDVTEKGPLDFGVKAVTLKNEPARLLQPVQVSQAVQHVAQLRTIPPKSTTPTGYSVALPTIPVLSTLSSPKPGGPRPPSGKPVFTTATAATPTQQQTYFIPRGGAPPPSTPPARLPQSTLSVLTVPTAVVRAPCPTTNSSQWGTAVAVTQQQQSPRGAPRGPVRPTTTLSSGKVTGRNVVVCAAPGGAGSAVGAAAALRGNAQLHLTPLLPPDTKPSAPHNQKLPSAPSTPGTPPQPTYNYTTVATTTITAIATATSTAVLQAPTATALAPVRQPQQHILTQRVAQAQVGRSTIGSNRLTSPVSSKATSSTTPAPLLAAPTRLSYTTPLLVSVAASPPRPPGNPGPLKGTPVTTTTTSGQPQQQGPRINHSAVVMTKVPPQPPPPQQRPFVRAATATGQTVGVGHLVVGSKAAGGNHLVTTARGGLITAAVGPKMITHVTANVSVAKPTQTTNVQTAAPTCPPPALLKQDVIKLTPHRGPPTTQHLPAAASVITTSSPKPLHHLHHHLDESPPPNTANLLIQQQRPTGNQQASPASQTATLSTYTLPSGASYFYEAPSGYQLATDAPLLARPLSPDAAARQLGVDVGVGGALGGGDRGPIIARPYTPAALLTTSSAMRFNPVMIVESNAAAAMPAAATVPNCTQSSVAAAAAAAAVNYTPGEAHAQTQHSLAAEASTTPTKSPRPSILRKRDNDCPSLNPSVTAKPLPVKNLTPLLGSRTPSPPPSSATATTTVLHCETSVSNSDLLVGPSSNGSTTISATSSPGLQDDVAECLQSNERLGDGGGGGVTEGGGGGSCTGSPRKKPRKQLLNDANTAIEMEFIADSTHRTKRKKPSASADHKSGHSGNNKCSRPVSLLRSYKHQWKTRINHFIRPSDVRVKEEKRPTVQDIAEQRFILKRIEGWKVHHLKVQLDELNSMENCILTRLSEIFKELDTSLGKDLEKEMNRVHDLIMGNMQRSKVIQDQVTEAESQIVKVFDHKNRVKDLLSRHVSNTALSGSSNKRNCKKREKY